ncbi:LPS assembly lipoprotein LptE [Desulfomicrobium orale]|nr:LPS assembly lipoprotein LptE [Desulfomicrobium orale]
MSKSSSSRKNWSTWWCASTLALLCLLSACGYRLSAQAPISLPQDNTRLYLGKVTNPSTETWLEPMLRSGLRDELTRRGRVVWVDREQAQSRVTLNVRQYSSSDSVKGLDDVTVTSQVVIQLEVSFFSTETNSLIWTSGLVTASESYRGAGAKRQATQNAVDLAMRMVADRLAQQF